MKKLALVGILAVTGAAATANAWEFRMRFIERVGNADGAVLEGDRIEVNPGQEYRIRLQFGVFDTDSGAAPAGGYVGWNVGTITVNGPVDNSDEFRNSAAGAHNGVGRLNPFAFSPASQGANGLPADDPFTAISGIDNTLGQQAPPWLVGQDMPRATVRGLNTWVSTYEFSIVPSLGFSEYTIDFGGNLIAAEEWRFVGDPIPPDDGGTPGDTSDDTPGTVTYAPFATDPVALAKTLTVAPIPAPGAAALLGLGGLVALRRRR